MIIRWPGRVPAGTTVDGPWGFVDMMPTMADVLDVAPPPDQDGLSVLQLWETGSQPGLAERWQYWEFHEGGYHQAARKGKWKAVRHTGKGEGVKLYDLDADLGETNDLAGEHPEITAMFTTYLETARTPSEHWRTPAETEAIKRSAEQAASP
jgi:arylsulfatase A-like enzyme